MSYGTHILKTGSLITLAMQDRVLSRDGTPIEIQSEGNGPGVVLVHGSAADGRDWRGIAPTLSRHCTVHVMHRRGRAGSGNGPTYGLNQECDDVLAVLHHTNANILVGHSFGALVCLEALRHVPEATRVVLIEPPILELANPPIPAHVRARLQPMLEEVGQTQGGKALVEAFLVQAANLTAEELALAKDDKEGWSTAVGCADTLPREAGAAARYRWNPAAFDAIQPQVLLVAGTETAAFFKAGIQALSEVLPHAQVRWVEGHGHMSVNTAPDVVANLIDEFTAGRIVQRMERSE